MRKPSHTNHKNTFDIIEESILVLRSIPNYWYLFYLVGTLPFVFGFVYYWTEMSRNVLTDNSIVSLSLLLAFLFIWMRCWQSIFMRFVQAFVCGEKICNFNFSVIGRLIAAHIILQPCSIILRLFSWILLFSFSWVYAFFQNVIVLAGEEDNQLQNIYHESLKQSILWQTQNILFIIVSFVLRFIVFINIFLCAIIIPYLLKTLLGINTLFSSGLWYVGDTTFLVTILALTYLCSDPLVKTFYMLRCFYGTSINKGRDIKADLQSLIKQKAVLLFCVIGFSICTCCFFQSTLIAATQSNIPVVNNHVVSSLNLDKAIHSEMQHPRYKWKLPKVHSQLNDASRPRFVQRIIDWLKSILDWIGEKIKAIANWIKDRFKNSPEPDVKDSSTWFDKLTAGKAIVILLSGIVLVVLFAILAKYNFFRQIRNKQKDEIDINTTLDIKDENITADQLPDDEWVAMAKDLLEKGEKTLALRAYFLSILSQLGQKKLITIKLFKTNRDYLNEVINKTHVFPMLSTPFSQNVKLFEYAWYGLHDVTSEILEKFINNLEIIKANINEKK
jgi:hypothetical protein